MESLIQGECRAAAAARHVIPLALQHHLDLRVQGLSKRYHDGSRVLNDISFAIGQKETVSLIGSNGAGKSTLLRCLLRLVEPSSGTVSLLGEEITAMRGRQLQRVRGEVGFIWQRHNLVPRLSVLSNVVHGALCRRSSPLLWYQGLAPARVREEAMECLDKVGLIHLAARRSDTLSGGESQRVAIARALMQRPRFMMADEPVASLDPKKGEELMELFVSLVAREGVTLLFTSHDLGHALHYADRVLGIHAGMLAINSPTDRMDAKTLLELYHAA